MAVSRKLWEVFDDCPKTACTTNWREEKIIVARFNCNCYDLNK